MQHDGHFFFLNFPLTSSCAIRRCLRSGNAFHSSRVTQRHLPLTNSPDGQGPERLSVLTPATRSLCPSRILSAITCVFILHIFPAHRSQVSAESTAKRVRRIGSTGRLGLQSKGRDGPPEQGRWSGRRWAYAWREGSGADSRALIRRILCTTVSTNDAFPFPRATKDTTLRYGAGGWERKSNVAPSRKYFATLSCRARHFL